MAATATASSLAMASLTPKTLSLFAAKRGFLSLPLSPSPLRSGLVVASKGFRGLSASRMVPKVAISSEFEQDEEVLSGDDGGSFSQDLKLFVGNLPFSCDSSQLAGLFERAGNVEMVEVIYDKTTGRSRGFGFVTMSSADEVEKAAQQFNGYELEGRALRVNYGPPPPRDESFPRGGRDGGSRYGGGGGGSDGGNRVYVGNLPWSVDNSALENLFSEQGKVLEAKVVYDRDSGRSRGFGFVTYDSADEVNNAIDSLNGAEMDGRQIRVTQAESRQRRSY